MYNACMFVSMLAHKIYIIYISNAFLRLCKIIVYNYVHDIVCQYDYFCNCGCLHIGAPRCNTKE